MHEDFLHLWQYVSEFFLEWDMFWTNVVEKIKTQFMFKNSPLPPSLPPENRAIYGIMRENIIDPDRPQITIWRMRIAYCITAATHTHSEYVILIAFPLQQCLNKPDSLLRYTYISRLVYDYACLTLILLKWKIWWASNNASRWQMGFNSAFKGLKTEKWAL